MNIAFMRFVDYWLGVPLAVATTVFVRLWDLFRPSLNLTERQRVLFIELSEMGSAILADTAIALVMTTLIYLAFDRLLTLSLPTGPLERLL